MSQPGCGPWVQGQMPGLLVAGFGAREVRAGADPVVSEVVSLHGYLLGLRRSLDWCQPAGGQGSPPALIG